ncbi:MAG: trypsin-like peptidase domain-containing protein [Planctomycetota bacterium]|nr:trypsin-like peptidase domain-containing protein [Planctomycetota bacterium]
MPARLSPLVLCAAAALLAGQPAPACAESPAAQALASLEAEQVAVHERAAPAVVAVACVAGAERQPYYGAGALLDADGLVLTASTAVPPNAREIAIVLRDGRRLPARVLARSGAVEAVVLRADTRQALPHLACGVPRELRPGARVYAAGNPHRTLERDGEVYWQAATFIAHAELRSDDERSRYAGPALTFNQSVNFGADGGVLLDAHGRLVGLLSLAYSRHDGRGAAVPIQAIRAALAEALAGVAPEDAPARPAALEPLERALRDAAAKVAECVVRIRSAEARAEPPLQAQQPDQGPDPVSHAEALPDTDRAPGAEHGPVCGVLVQPAGTVLMAASSLPETSGPFEIELRDGRRRRARLGGRHQGLDVAALLLDDAAGLPALELAEGPAPRLGQLAALVGSAERGASEGPLNWGLVSALERFDGQAVQLDARLGAADAGAAVVDLRGRFLGLLARMDRRKVWAAQSGVAFYAPAPRLLEALQDLRAGRVVESPPQSFLGVRPALGETAFEGIKLAEVVEASPAWKAGLRKNDVVTGLDGQAVRSWPALLGVLRRHEPGSRLALRYLRDEKPQRGSVVLDARP